MSLKELFSLAFKALRSNLLRTLLTMLGIIIGISSVIIIISLGDGATKSITNQLSSFGTNLIIIAPGSQGLTGGTRAPSRTDTLTIDDAQALATSKIPNLEAVAPAIGTYSVISADGQSGSANVLGITENYFAINELTVDKGSIITDDDNAAMARVAFIGPQVAIDLFGENPDPVGKTMMIGNKNFKIVGFCKPKGSAGLSNPDKNVYIPLKTGSKLIFGRDYLTIMFARAANPQLLDQTVSDIKTFLLDRHKITNPDEADFSVTTSKDALSTLSTVTGLLTLLLSGIAGISLVVGGIGIMNIMLVTVTERTKEIGLLKAIGAKSKDILSQILVESLVLTFTGGLIGIIIGVSVSYLLAQIVKIPFVVQPSSILLAVGVSTIVGITFGLYPAKKAAKLNPIDALKYE